MTQNGSETIAKTLVEVEGYKDLPKPVILTSGEIGIYYINTEKLAQDGGKWESFAEDSQAMINHCVSMAEQKPSFAQVVDILAAKVESLFPADVPKEKRAISGGQRRDWLFSGPVARKLALPHISLHKDRSTFLLSSDGTEINVIEDSENALADYCCVHVVDLLTKGSSAYNPENNPPTGWIVELRKRGAQVDHLVSVVSRLQGGEEILASVDVETHSFVKIERDFVATYSQQADQALAYIDDPMLWSRNFIKEQGIEVFVESFNPSKGKLERAKKFVAVYEDILSASGRMSELKERVLSDFAVSL